MRGLAAFAVLIYHFIFSLDKFHYWEGCTVQHWLSCVFNGSDAVSFFFVLSGLVLSYKYFNRPDNEPLRINYMPFLVQRIFRIFPAYMLMLLISFLYAHREELSAAFITDAIFTHNYDFVHELILIRNHSNLYTPGWTLSVEVVMSFLVPVFVVVCYKTPRMFSYLIPLSILMSAFISSFVFHFMLGVWLGKNYKHIQAYDFKQSSIYRYRYPVYLIVFMMLSVRHLDRIQPFHLFYYYPNHYLGIDFFHLTGLASFLILWKAINDQAWQRVLNQKPFLWLGKISYSIYLTHWFVIFYLFTPRPQDIAEWLHMPDNAYRAGFIFCVLSTLGASVVLYYFIEKPFNTLGKKWSKQWFANQQSEEIS
jgi:peptidoglycan/LPS O-acetylase OafA/YrhL